MEFKIGDLVRYDFIFNGLGEMIGIILDLEEVDIKSEYNLSPVVFTKVKLLDEDGVVSWVGSDRIIKLGN